MPENRHFQYLFFSISLAAAANFSMLTAGAVPPNAPPLPASIEITTSSEESHLLETAKPTDDLQVKIYKHKLNAMTGQPEAWSYVTDGLKNSGQQEILLTVLKSPQENDHAYPQLPVKLFASIQALAKQNKIVKIGGYTEFKSQGFLAPQFKGLIYTAVAAKQGIPVPEDCIAMVPITAEEMEVYQIAGASRVMARLGRESQFFPCPSWCDRNRASIFSAEEIEEMKTDPVFRSAKAQTFALTAVQNQDSLSLKMTDKTAELLLDLLKQLPSDSALRLALGLDRQADALLVWENKKNHNRSLIAPPESTYKSIGISFIALLPGVGESEILSGSDGCALMLTKADYDRFCDALAKKQPLILSMAEKSVIKSFAIDWREK